MSLKNITSAQVCLAVEEMHRLKILPGYRFIKAVEILMDRTLQRKKVCESAIIREIKLGKVEYGIGSSIGWLTYDGIAFLKTLHDNEHSNE